jgi:hypothetical protein
MDWKLPIPPVIKSPSYMGEVIFPHQLHCIKPEKGLLYGYQTSVWGVDFPWGLWKGFNVITGVAFAGGAYLITFVVYVMKVEKYHPIVRVTVLNGEIIVTFTVIFSEIWVFRWIVNRMPVYKGGYI